MRCCLIGIVVVVTWLCCCVARAQVSFTDTGVTYSSVVFSMGINDGGQVYMNTGSGQLFREPNGSVFVPAPPPGSAGVIFWTINNSGALGGEANVSGGTRAVIRYPDGSYVTPIPSGNSRGSGINDFGDAVGWIPGFHDAPFLYQAASGNVTTLPEPSGSTSTDAFNMNNAGWVTGRASFPGGSNRTWRYVPGGGVSLIPLNANEPLDMNNHGVVVGQGATGSFRWEVDGSVTNLSTPGGLGAAFGINDANEVVGDRFTSTGALAMYWFPDGSGIDLNTLLTPAQQVNWTLIRGWDINEGHTIVGESKYDADGAGGPIAPVNHVFLMTIPEPSFTAAVSLLALALLRRRSA